MNRYRLMVGDVRARLAELPAESVQCVVTSPPYWGLRDYGIEPQVWGGRSDCIHAWGDEIVIKAGGGQPGEKSRWQHTGEGPSGHPSGNGGAFCAECGAWRGSLGLEPTPELYTAHVVEVFREVRRVLRVDGVLWLNLGDCYATGAGKVGECPGGGAQGARWAGTGGSRGPNESKANGRGERRRELRDGTHAGKHTAIAAMGPMTQPNRLPIPGLKPKDLVGIPWRVAFALQADGWWLRMDNIWAKPNPMPESVTDRPTKAHEYVFLLSKSASYFYDADAIREASIEEAAGNSERKFRGDYGGAPDDEGRGHQGFSIPWAGSSRNRRSVWTIATQPYPEAHFATFPEALVEPCIKAGTSERGACPKCGAPWQREVEREFVPQQDVALDKGVRGAGEQKPLDSSNGWQGVPRGSTLARTLGWSTSCDCTVQVSPVSVPCIVFDPFAGSGTALMVALRLGREGWGIELSPKYVELARARIEGDAPLLNRHQKEPTLASG